MLATNWEDAESEQDETYLDFKKIRVATLINHGKHMVILNEFLVAKIQSKPTISVANGYQMNVTGTNWWTNVQQLALKSCEQNPSKNWQLFSQAKTWLFFDNLLKLSWSLCHLPPAIQNHKMLLHLPRCTFVNSHLDVATCSHGRLSFARLMWAPFFVRNPSQLCNGNLQLHFPIILGVNLKSLYL